MHNPLGHAFTVEMRHLLEEQKVFKYDWTSRSCSKRILVVADWTSGSGR
jgi:hypothetical protein